MAQQTALRERGQQATSSAGAAGRSAARSTRRAARSASGEGRRVASQATAEGRRVAGRAAGEGRRVADDASAQAREVGTQAKEQARQVGTTAVERSTDVARTTARDVREVAATAREQALVVAGEVSDQTRSLLEETRSRLEAQTQEGFQRLGDSCRQLGGEARALAEGRPEDAPVLSDYAWRAADTLGGVADRLEQLAEEVESDGLPALLEELQSIARRRPGLFLLGAAVAGVGVGRLVRAGRDDGDSEPEAVGAGRTARTRR
jgi:hypothetical protein